MDNAEWITSALQLLLSAPTGITDQAKLLLQASSLLLSVTTVTPKCKDNMSRKAAEAREASCATAQLQHATLPIFPFPLCQNGGCRLKIGNRIICVSAQPSLKMLQLGRINSVPDSRGCHRAYPESSRLRLLQALAAGVEVLGPDHNPRYLFSKASFGSTWDSLPNRLSPRTSQLKPSASSP